MTHGASPALLHASRSYSAPSAMRHCGFVDWIRRYILFHGKRHPNLMGATEVESFLTHLAVNGKWRHSRKITPRRHGCFCIARWGAVLLVVVLVLLRCITMMPVFRCCGPPRSPRARVHTTMIPSASNMRTRRMSGSPMSAVGSSPSKRSHNAMPSFSDLNEPAQ